MKPQTERYDFLRTLRQRKEKIETHYNFINLPAEIIKKNEIALSKIACNQY